MFDRNFVWGAATSAYQIEGAAFEDGKGASIWDVFTHRDGKIFENHNGDVACDHYHRYKEDIAVMKALGLKAYRFSICWPRIFPEGTGRVNQKGVEFYNNLINCLIENDIVPFITLFHWDYPQALAEKGGWLNPESPRWFADYAAFAARVFGDRVEHFITFNEPQCFIGYAFGRCHSQAPDVDCSDAEVTRMCHNVLLAHGLAVAEMRKSAPRKIKIGFSPCGSWKYPSDESNERDVQAAWDATFSMKEYTIGLGISWWSDAVALGRYPEDGLEKYGKYLPAGWQEDMKIISEPIDFMGQNHYNGAEAVGTEDGGYKVIKPCPGYPMTANNWPITPKSIKWCAKNLYKRYKLPIYITENGLSCRDTISLDGKVHDYNRIDFLNKYLIGLSEAIDEGAEVLGYFTWSLMDNFEWNNGYRERFGLVYVDYRTQKRIIKDSGFWYKNIIETNGEALWRK